ncbi:phosphomannomutase [Ostreiculturibacter nitratireducens]|uniref:phosphomannomutase n=1 Tax=Ostreiculturibacter nitratireducens TaxID=3075226 RepID=UPI0031B62299
MTRLNCFKAYDIRGRAGIELDEGVAFRIGRAFARALGASPVVIGRDPRLSSPALAAALAEGLVAEGSDVLDLGLCGTEEVYFATGHLNAGGGIMITASHNPAEWNGMKMVREGAAPLDPVADLYQIRALAEADAFGLRKPGGAVRDASATRAAYVDHVLGMTDVAAMQPLTILANAGNGAAGPTLDALAEGLASRGAPLRFVRVHHEPDGEFPFGAPNPILPENHAQTAEPLREAGADMGVAWDGDFDRCFLFDATGRFIPGEHVVSLLAAAFLSRAPGETIVHDPRVVLGIRDTIARAGGRAVMAKTGHVYLKRAMRETGAIYGGEMSAHHYFRDFFACDSGMIPWLLVAELMGRKRAALASLVDDLIARFPSSGERNFRPEDPEAAIARVMAAFGPEAAEIDETDGLSLSFPGWRFSLRQSNTEALVRLNVEAEGDAALVSEMTQRISALLET